MATSTDSQAHSLVESSFPVLLPAELRNVTGALDSRLLRVQSTAYASSDVSEKLKTKDEHRAPFMAALIGESKLPTKTRTANGDAAFARSGSRLLDLFNELEDIANPEDLNQLLWDAWAEEPEVTLRLIWNARSIHLGKSNRFTFYRAMGWLAQSHPDTFLYSLPWLVRPIIRKAKRKSTNKTEERLQHPDGELIDEMDCDSDSDYELVNASAEKPVQKTEQARIQDTRAVTEFDVKYGHSHGYWKDLLNLLVLAAHDQLRINGRSRETLNKHNPVKKHSRNWTPGQRRERLVERHAQVLELLNTSAFYKKLHVTVAQLFAEQLSIDLARLRSCKPTELKRISMAAKWAPSNKGSHDSQTFIASTIAELLYPIGEVVSEHDRAEKIKQARIAYQSQTLAPLRRHLDLVERHITDQSFDKIDYSHVPSLAMKQYTKLFLNKDLKHFEEYLTDVASGKATVSGAVLLPSVLIATARQDQAYYGTRNTLAGKQKEIEHKLSEQLLDGQWETLVQRIKNSGKLESAIAVCDVSGSMTSPRFADGTTPLDSALGLSLILADVTEAPFGGAFITFSDQPEIVQVGGKDDKRSLKQKCDAMVSSSWGMNTNFTAVFQKLILPMAVTHNLKPADMIKRIFVFSDMQFDAANTREDEWSTSYQTIKRDFERHGYAIPELVFWNLASDSSNTSHHVQRPVWNLSSGVSNAWNQVQRGAKPVYAEQPRTALVSGYSQAMLKLFLDGSSFEDQADEAETEVVLSKDEKTGAITEQKEAKEAMTPLKMMHKAIGHEAYRMLRVLD